jgi:hypothetical protein
MLIVDYQQRFHVEPLLILDPINLRPTFRPESLHKILFPSHAAATGLPSRKRLERMQPPLGPCHRRRRHRRDPIMPLCWDPFTTVVVAVSRPLHRHHHRSTTKEQGPHPVVPHHCPRTDLASSVAGPSDPRLKTPSVTVT